MVVLSPQAAVEVAANAVGASQPVVSAVAIQRVHWACHQFQGTLMAAVVECSTQRFLAVLLRASGVAVTEPAVQPAVAVVTADVAAANMS